jgi:hypothetical protein
MFGGDVFGGISGEKLAPTENAGYSACLPQCPERNLKTTFESGLRLVPPIDRLTFPSFFRIQYGSDSLSLEELFSSTRSRE